MIRFPDGDPIGFCNSEPDADRIGFRKNSIGSDMDIQAGDEHGSRLDRTRSGLKPILAGSGLDRTAIFFKFVGPGLDQTVNFFVVLM